MWPSVTSYGVDAPHDLGDGGDVLGNEADPCIEERPHALRDGQRPQLVVGGLLQEQVLHLLGDLEQLVHADPVLVARLETEVAAFAVPEQALGYASRILVEAALLHRRRVRDLAERADPAYEALGHH